jgi:hypothetical protein
MAVEIYLEPELLDMVGSQEVTDEWKMLVEELGLEGQQKLISPKTDGDNKNPSPYIHMNKKFERILAVLCPEAVDYKKYDKTTIPREVLREIALCEKEKYFDKIKIWYDDASPDPVVVGYIKESEYSYIKHIIARFGDEILPFDILENKATDRMKTRIITKLKASLSSVDVFIDDFFNPSRYGSSDDFRVEVEGVKYHHGH